MLSRAPRLLVAAAVLTTVVVSTAVLTTTPVLSAPAGPGDAAGDAVDLDAELDAARGTEARIETQLEGATAERDDIGTALGDRRSRRERATADLRAARAATRTLAVAAYVDGGTSGAEAVLLAGGSDLTEDAYRSTLLTSSAASRRQTSLYFGELRRQADDAVTSTLDQLDHLEARVRRLRARRAEAQDAIRAARSAVAAAEAAATKAAAPPSVTPVTTSASGASGPWQPIGTLPGGPTPEQWARLRNCESTGNYRAVSPSGAYRGAYQFDLSTWRTVGGSGDPAAAPPAEQDHRAQRLYAGRGASPWPVCGRYLY